MNEDVPQFKPIIVTIQQILEKWNDYRYNIVTGELEFQCKDCDAWVKMDDYEINSLHIRILENNHQISISGLQNLLKSNFAPKYNPFNDYFESLTAWDGKTNYIQLLAETINTTNNELWNKTLPKWIVASVACVLDDSVTNHTMIVFTGQQGLGKTTWSLKLVPEKLLDYKYSGTINPDNKDTLVFLSECFLINIDELEVLSRKQLGSLKQLLTKESVKIRRPYGRINENMPRRASFISSINDKEFLTDLTGSRRFLIFEALTIDYKHSINMDDVYSQAVALWKSGFKFWFDTDEITEINRYNERYRVKTIEEEIVLNMYEPCEKGMETSRKTASEILTEIHHNNKNNITNWNLIQLGKLLKHLGFKQGKSGGRLFYYLKAKNVDQNVYPTGFCDQNI